MEYDVYADIMFLTNLTVDFFIISISRLILKHHTSFLKMLLAATFGAVYATVTYFLDFIPFALKVLVDIISLAVIAIITYGFGNYKRTLLRISLVFLLSLLFGGVVFAFYFFTPLGAVFYLFDGSYYFDISFITVFFLAAASAVWLHSAASDSIVAEGIDPSIVNTAAKIGSMRVRLDGGAKCDSE